jgi:hypothetical protein
MDRIAALSTGTKIMLAAGILLFFDLFLTWQRIALDYGPRVQVTSSLDGWDFWGLLIGFLTIMLLGIVAVRELDDEITLSSRWELATLALAVLVLGFAILKNLRDTESTWASYLGVALAGLLAFGALVDWWQARAEPGPLGAGWRPQPAGPSGQTPGPESGADEPRSRW